MDQWGNNGLGVAPKFIRQIELHAACLRQQVGIGPIGKFSPRTLADKLNIKIAYPDEIKEAAPKLQQLLLSLDAKVWSGMSNTLPEGSLLILLNPNQTSERENVTIMEEVAHRYYGHEPSHLNKIGRGRYDESIEREAFWTAAATLLPAKAVGQAVWSGGSAEQLAATYGTSVELAEMRIKTLNIWSFYKKQGVQSRKNER